MPHSAEAEQAVLGSMIIDARCIGDVVGVLKASDFYSPDNRDIFVTIYSMFVNAETVDPVTVLKHMRVSGVYTESSAAYLLDLVNMTPTAANVMEYAKSSATWRCCATSPTPAAKSTTRPEAAGDASDILEAAERKITPCGRTATSRASSRFQKSLLTLRAALRGGKERKLNSRLSHGA